MSDRPVLVLGGGITGLMAAWHLQRRGFPVEVWEAGAEAGGWARTLPWPGPGGEPGFLERGPQALRLARGGALEGLLRELVLEGLLRELVLEVRPPGPRGPRWLAKAGRRHPGPVSLEGLLRTPGLGLGGALRMLAEPFAPAAPAQEEDLRAFFARRLGERFARELLPALVAGVLAAPPERLGLAALPRLRMLEARGGLLLGSLRAGPEPTRVPRGGVGALAQALAARVPLRPDRAAMALEPLAGGGWRARGGGSGPEAQIEAEVVVLALPSGTAADLLRPLAPGAAERLATLPRLDLRIWHSRHAPVPGWARGFGLRVHPPEGRGLLGAVSLAADDPRGVPGLMQVRTYLGGAYPVAPELEAWPGVFAELRRWLPELGEAVQVREEACPGAFPLLAPGHEARVGAILADLPPGLHWLGADRFGPGLPDLAEGIETWAAGAVI